MFEEWGSLQKHKKTRLTGKPLAALNQKIYERDGGCCIICGRPVPEGSKFHHVRQAADKEDTMDNGVLLCYECHQQAHSGAVLLTRSECRKYLEGLYGK
ncbi:MAG: HNH endonuclease [Selenomonadaceae bacterium]